MGDAPVHHQARGVGGGVEGGREGQGHVQLLRSCVIARVHNVGGEESIKHTTYTVK